MEQSASRTAPHPAPPPAPPAPLDLDQLGDRIAELSARIQAATYDLLCDLRVFDRRHGWEGFRSCAHWLNWRTGLDLGAARTSSRHSSRLFSRCKTMFTAWYPTGASPHSLCSSQKPV